MDKLSEYEKQHEIKLISLLKNEPDWSLFTNEKVIDRFKQALFNSETYVCEHNNEVCGYIRALVDGFGLYVSELYVAPPHRNKGYGRKLLYKLKENHPDQNVYVLSDEDLYYEKLGLDRIVNMGQVFV